MPTMTQISESVGKLLGKLSKNKKMIGSSVGVGLGLGLATNYITDDGHDKSDHIPKKYASDMTAQEKADQKYAIAKSYERHGHPRKANEYKDKASKAYKRAWEKKGEKVDQSVIKIAVDRWMQGAVKRPGALSRKLGYKESDNIPMSVINSKLSELHAKAQKGKLSASELRLVRELTFAKNAKKAKH